jgi:hypothetical protein
MLGAEVLKASRASAGTLLALLLGVHQANATPTTTTGSPQPTCACLTVAGTAAMPGIEVGNPATGFASIAIVPYAPAGRNTFAPVMPDKIVSGAATSPLETISSLNRTLVFEHAKPGKMAAATSGWSNAGGTSVYVGTSPTMALRDGGAGGSLNTGYGINPVGSSDPTEPNDQGGVSGAAYIPNSGASSPGAAGARTRLSKSVAASSPIYASSIVGSQTINTLMPGTQSLVDFATIELTATHTLELAIMNLAKGARSSTSDLVIEGYSITGADPESFSVASLDPGTVIPAGGTLLLPITVVGTGPGDLTSNLTIFTNEGTALGGAGETFNYLLDPMVTNGFSTAASEPASLAVFGIGLAALAGVRRRRRSRSASR